MVVCGTVEIRAQFDPGLIATRCAIGNRDVFTGDAVGVGVVVTNGNRDPAAVQVELRSNGSVLETFSATVASGGTENFTATVSFDEAGSYPVNAVVTSATRA